MNVHFLTLPLPSLSANDAFAKEVAKELSRCGTNISLDGHTIFARVHPRDKRGCNLERVSLIIRSTLQFCGIKSARELEVAIGPIVPGGRIEILIGELPCQP